MNGQGNISNSKQRKVPSLEIVMGIGIYFTDEKETILDQLRRNISGYEWFQGKEMELQRRLEFFYKAKGESKDNNDCRLWQLWGSISDCFIEQLKRKDNGAILKGT